MQSLRLHIYDALSAAQGCSLAASARLCSAKELLRYLL